MRKLSEVEVLSLTGLLKMEKDSLAVSEAYNKSIMMVESQEK